MISLIAQLVEHLRQKIKRLLAQILVTECSKLSKKNFMQIMFLKVQDFHVYFPYSPLNSSIKCYKVLFSDSAGCGLYIGKQVEQTLDFHWFPKYLIANKLIKAFELCTAEDVLISVSFQDTRKMIKLMQVDKKAIMNYFPHIPFL